MNYKHRVFKTFLDVPTDNPFATLATLVLTTVLVIKNTFLYYF